MGHLLFMLKVLDDLELEGSHGGIIVKSYILINKSLSEIVLLHPHLSRFSLIRVVKLT